MYTISCEAFINMFDELMIPAEERLFKNKEKKPDNATKIAEGITKKYNSDVGNISDEEKEEIKKQCREKSSTKYGQ